MDAVSYEYILQRKKMEVCFIAHRGYSGKYLENTEEAFVEAIRHGSGGIETDVRVTADGILVVSHNNHVIFADGTELPVSTDSTGIFPLEWVKQHLVPFSMTWEEKLPGLAVTKRIC